MSSRPWLAVGLALLAVLGGCTGAPAVDAGRDGADDGTDDSGPASPGGPDPGYDAYVFDHAGIPAPAIEGGIVYDTGNRTVRRYVTLVTTRAAAAERFNRSVLDEEARAFVENTSFEDSYLVVFQVFPASSSPDYRVEGVTRTGQTVRLRVNDSARGGTADVTVETLLVRLPRGEAPPERVAVVTEENATVRSGEGVVYEAPTPPDDDEDGVTLPYRGPDAATNLDDPLGVRVRNGGTEVNGFRLTLTYVGAEVTVLDTGWRKLRAGGTWTVEAAVARTGAYRVEVAASLPAENGSRRRVSTTATWNVTAESGPLRIRITDENVTVDGAPAA